jgi:RHS repeat-associated protein
VVRTPQNVQANRTVPAHAAASTVEPISDNPSDQEIGRLHLFAERMVPVEPASSQSGLSAVKSLFVSKKPAPLIQDNRHVVNTLRGLQTTANFYDTTQLKAFISAHPDSRWTPAFRQELHRRQFKQGWFAQAVAGWDELWDQLKDRRDPGAVEVANEVLSDLLEAYMGLGKADRLATLVGEQESRPGHPVIQSKLMRAKQSVWLLKHKGAQNVMCGPLALYCILGYQNQPFVPIRLNDVTDDYIATGISLSQLKEYSDRYKMGLVMARKSPGRPVPTPAVMHLASGHFSAILSQTNGSYFLEDRPMQFQGWVSLEALEAQGSGFFLIPAGALPPGWQPVSRQEGGEVFGRDGLHGHERFAQSIPKPPQTCAGMPRYSFLPEIASLLIQDTPVGYVPPVGPSVMPRIAYNDLDDSKPVGRPTFSNVGRMWSLNWVAYVDYLAPPLQNGVKLTVHVAGGGIEVFTYSSLTGIFGPNDRSFATVAQTGTNTYVRTLPDGSREIYNAPDNPGATNRIFLTQTIDPQGNALSFTYDASNRLVAATDTIGQVTTLEYNWPGDSWKVTKISDPFGRFASFAYNNNSNELSSVTDVLSLTSTFTYDATEFVNSMTTPYGTTTFSNTRSNIPAGSYDYALTATDPEGNREKVRYVEPIGIPPLGPPLPSKISVGGTNVTFIAEDARLAFRNSFYWNKKAMKEGPDDFTLARNYRWLTDANYLVVPILEADKEPLENRVWFNYPGQVGGSPYASYPYYAGQGSRPEKTLRMLSDGTAQLTQNYYNSLGNVTTAVDPVGRTTIYSYATNQIDLLEVRQQTAPGTSERLAAYTWNSQHLPLMIVDEAGQTNRFSYNNRGQLLTATNALGETTTFTYDTNGFLLVIDPPLPGTNDAIRFTYDAFGRRRTVTGPDGYTLTFDYDAMDRLTVITYPDGTYEQRSYDRLDLAVQRDRLGRQTHYTYNNLRQLTQVQDALNRVTHYDWCECGALTSLTDPMGRMTSWQHDFQNRVIAKLYPDGSRIGYNYDTASSRLKSVVDEKGQLSVYDYFHDDTISRISYPNAQVSTPTVTFGYDTNYPRLTSMQDGIGTTTWSYYPPGALGALQISLGVGPWNNASVQYQYDALGRETNRAINGVSRAYAYDALGRITNIVNALGSFGYSYDGATPRMLDVANPNGQTTHYDYFDNLGDRRLQRITHRKGDASLLSRFEYAYNAVGRITNWVQNLSVLTNVWTIGYDAADQLLSVAVDQGGGGTLNYSYGYDAAGNRLSETSNGVVHAFSYNVLNQLVSASEPGYTNVSYEWDAEQRLAAFNHGGNRSEFGYDGFGRRVQIVERVNGGSASTNCFLWCDDTICEQRDASGAAVLRRFYPAGEVVLGGNGVTNYFYTRDHLGSIREVVDNQGTTGSRYGYDPYGKQGQYQTGADATFGFAGYFVHKPSGLNLTWFRALRPDLGRWLSRDPIGEGGTEVNLYAYVSNDPINSVDPDGLTKCLSKPPKQSPRKRPPFKLDPPGPPDTSNDLAFKLALKQFTIFVLP